MGSRSRAFSKGRISLPLVVGLVLSAAIWFSNETPATAGAPARTACGPTTAASAECPVVSGAARLAFAAKLEQSAAAHVPTAACGTAEPGRAQCFAEEVAISPDSPAPGCLENDGGYDPCDLQSAYDLPSATNGAGRTVAVVDAFDDANAESDLAVYRSNFGLPACTTANGCFQKVDQTGGNDYPGPPPAGDNWIPEIGLDLDMVSAICPNCHIILVEADSDQDNSLFLSEDEAVALGATEISNSWGGPEFIGENTGGLTGKGYDQYFNHAGIAITASTGDNGYRVAYPAASPYVTAVGGTNLTPTNNARGWTEAAWNGAGSGCSSVEAQPSWQTANAGVKSHCARRADADVSAVAGTGTPVFSYDSADGGWIEVGGTSVASPIIASVYALTTSAPINGASYIYSHTSGLNDVTSGSNGSCGGINLCTAVSGWDGPTGLGTPDGTTAFGTGVPIVRSVTPASGPLAGGQVITVAGTGFAAGMTVTIGGTSVTPSAVSYASFTLTTPAEAAGTVDVQVTTSGGESAFSSADDYTYVAPANYTPMATPFRILNTRGGAPLGPNSSRTVQITGVGSIPTAAVAVVLNVTEVDDPTASLLTVYPAGTPKPNASNLNFNAGTTTPNLVTVTLGAGGAVVIYNAAGSVTVIADVEGYFEPPASPTPLGEFHPINPVRVCDTRSSTLAPSACKTHGVLIAGIPMLTTITTGGQIPGGGMAEAAVLNLTAVEGSAPTYVSVYPPASNGTCSTPSVSTINVLAGAVEANRVMVGLGPGPSGPDTAVCVFSAAGKINILLDANGWFGTGAAPTGYQYQAIVPSRICDTRKALAGCAAGTIGAGLPNVRSVSVDGVGGVPSATSGTVVQAVIANLTAVTPTQGTFLVAYPADLPSAPNASDINLAAGATLPNLIVVQLDTSGDTHNGHLDLLNSVGSVNAIIDIEGWFQ
ncbi:MAG TPA: IPT/TIG domain-containing protein [Candidatus Dormibacteraeota bacterium]